MPAQAFLWYGCPSNCLSWLAVEQRNESKQKVGPSALLKDTLMLLGCAHCWSEDMRKFCLYFEGKNLVIRINESKLLILAAAGCEAQRGQVITPRITELMSKQEQSPLSQ